MSSTCMYVGKVPPLPNVGLWTADLGTCVKVELKTNVPIKVREDLTYEFI